jgi:hypothetical protein
MVVAGTNGTKWARYFTAGVIIVAGAGAFAVTAAGNYAYGLSQGTNDPFLFSITTKHVSAYGSLVADIAAVGFATALPGLCRDRSWFMALGALVLCIIATVFAFSNTVGFLGMERASAEAIRKHGAGGYDALKEQIALLTMQRNLVPQARPSDVVAADIAEKEMNDLFKRSKQCTDATLDDSKKFCGDLQKLRTEAAAAGRYAMLNRDIVAAQARLDGTAPVVSTDFLAASANTMFGVTEDVVGTWQPFAKATVLCLLAVFCFAVADGVLACGTVQPSSSNQPVITVASPTEVQVTPLSPAVPCPENKEEDAPYIEVEKPLRTAVGQALDGPGHNVTAFLPKPVSAEEGVARWARQMEAGSYSFDELKPLYEAYQKRWGFPKIRVHQLGTYLKGLGYDVSRPTGKRGKLCVSFPISLEVHPKVALR